jgi:hypothetical protein
MTAEITTDNISAQRVERLDRPGGWLVAFESANAGMCHQLYANGRLADCTDSPAERTLRLDGAPAPVALVVAAVPPHLRFSDLAGSLPSADARPGWLYSRTVVGGSYVPDGTRMELLDDHASGEFADEPVASVLLAPPWTARWGFALAPFASDAFGHDAGPAPGLGMGAFAGGQFGFDAPATEIACPLAEEGTHQLRLRTLRGDGAVASGEVESFESHPPPPPAEALTVSGYDAQTNELFLTIE